MRPVWRLARYPTMPRPFRPPRARADWAARPKIHAHRDAFAHVDVIVVDQPLARVQLAQALGIEQRVAVAETDLREPRALAHQHREGLRADLGVERAVIAGLDAIKPAGLVGDHPGEDVEPAGRALRIGGGRDVVGKRQALQQRHDVDAAGFEHGAVAEGNLVQLELVDALGDRGVGAGQEARAHPIGHLAEPQVEAGGLDLVGDEVIGGQNPTALRQRRDHVVGQDAFLIDCKGERHFRGLLRPQDEGKRYPTTALTERYRPRIRAFIPWSFEPAGLQPRKTNR